MGHKCFVSFKMEDEAYKLAIRDDLEIDMIDKSLREPINSDNEDYILSVIRAHYLADSTVTIHLIGVRSAEILGWHEQRFIKRELQASLYNGQGDTRSGILGVVLPSMYASVYGSVFTCPTCGLAHQYVVISDSTVVGEFSRNFFIPNGKCHHPDEDRYCVLVRWDEFVASPDLYIEQAFAKRTALIAGKVQVYPK